MDQLLNCGSGLYNYLPEMNDDPDDNRTPEEKAAQGCMAAIISLFITFLVCGIISLFTSCASHKTMTKVSMEKKDSVAVVLTDTVNKFVERKDSTYTAWEDTTHEVCGVTESVDGNEVIVEHIEESVDSAGNKTTITDRTTNRSFSLTMQKNMEQWQRHQEEQTALLLSRLDSMAQGRVEQSAMHYESADSTHEDKQQSASNPVSWYEDVKMRIGGCVLMALLVMGVIVAIRKFNERKKV